MRDTPSYILIVKLSAIGDVVHALPFLEVLRDNFPAAEIDWLVEEEASGLIQGHPALNRVIVSRRNAWKSSMGSPRTYLSVGSSVARFLNQLRKTHYDWVIDLQGLLKSGILTGLARGRNKLGMDGGREGGWLFWNQEPVPVSYAQHAIDRYLQVAWHLGCKPVKRSTRIPVSRKDRLQGYQLLGRDVIGDGPLVAINPVARWRTKLWEPERFAELADRLVEEVGCRVVFTGGPGDYSPIEGIREAMRNRSFNSAGQTSLRSLAALFEMSDVVVSTDTGPMHIAAAMGCRLVALFGPTAPWRTGPYGSGHRVIQSHRGCSPCFKKTCPEVMCMADITVEEAYGAVKELLLEGRAGAGVSGARSAEKR